MLTDNIQVNFPAKLWYIHLYVCEVRTINIGILQDTFTISSGVPSIPWLLHFISKLHNNCWNSRHCIYLRRTTNESMTEYILRM